MLTIPKRLRLHTRCDRQLLGKLCSYAWTCIQAEVRRLLRRDDVVPGMVAAIPTHEDPRRVGRLGPTRRRRFAGLA